MFDQMLTVAFSRKKQAFVFYMCLNCCTFAQSFSTFDTGNTEIVSNFLNHIDYSVILEDISGDRVILLPYCAQRMKNEKRKKKQNLGPP